MGQLVYKRIFQPFLGNVGNPEVSIGGGTGHTLTQAVRHAAFIAATGLGVQETAVMLFAHCFGVDHEVVLSLALVKRMRDVLLGVFALASSQGAGMLRMRSPVRRAGTHAPAVAPGKPRQWKDASL